MAAEKDAAAPENVEEFGKEGNERADENNGESFAEIAYPTHFSG